MTRFGFGLSSEEHTPLELVRFAKAAEDAGLDFLMISDHFHPWTSGQGNSPFVWSVIGGIAAATERIQVGTGVTCPTMRIHPAIIAHASATAAAMLPGRFVLGLGTGEALNEHVLGDAWPAASQRLDMLDEAIDIIRELWTGEEVSRSGEFYTVDRARLFTIPEEPPPILVAAASPAAARIAAANDGLVMTGPDEKVLDAFRQAGGGRKPRYAQVTVCWDPDPREAERIAVEKWPTSALSWALKTDISTPELFDGIVEHLPRESILENVVTGTSASIVLDGIREYERAGIDHIYIHQIGPRQEDFLAMVRSEVLPEIRKAA
jgi:coenzyme F420-dependent glucose-6-phosphate dehydrogenase